VYFITLPFFVRKIFTFYIIFQGQRIKEARRIFVRDPLQRWLQVRKRDEVLSKKRKLLVKIRRSL